MEVDALIERKKGLERGISLQVSKLVEEFKAETNASPKFIFIDMVETTEFDAKSKNYCVGECDVSIEL